MTTSSETRELVVRARLVLSAADAGAREHAERLAQRVVALLGGRDAIGASEAVVASAPSGRDVDIRLAAPSDRDAVERLGRLQEALELAGRAAASLGSIRLPDAAAVERAQEQIRAFLDDRGSVYEWLTTGAADQAQAVVELLREAGQARLSLRIAGWRRVGVAF